MSEYNRREHMAEQGFFDGRFRQKAIVAKKQQQNRKACKNVRWSDYEDDLDDNLNEETNETEVESDSE